MGNIWSDAFTFWSWEILVGVYVCGKALSLATFMTPWFGVFSFYYYVIKPISCVSILINHLFKKGDLCECLFYHLPAVPIAAPSLSLTNPNYHTILVSWSPLTAEQSQGKVIKYRIFYKTEDTPEVLEDVPADQTSFYIRGEDTLNVTFFVN